MDLVDLGYTDQEMLERLVSEHGDHPWYRDLTAGMAELHHLREEQPDATIEDALRAVQSRRRSPERITDINLALDIVARLRDLVAEWRVAREPETHADLVTLTDEDLLAAKAEAVRSEMRAASESVVREQLAQVKAEIARARAAAVDVETLRRIRQCSTCSPAVAV